MLLDGCAYIPANGLYEGVAPPCALPLQMMQGLSGLGCPGKVDCPCKHKNDAAGFQGLGDLADVSTYITEGENALSSFGGWVENAVGGFNFGNIGTELSNAFSSLTNSLGNSSTMWWVLGGAGALMLLTWRPGYRKARRSAVRGARRSHASVAGRIKRSASAAASAF